MKIYREIDGIEYEFQLTTCELIDARDECDKHFIREEIKVVSLALDCCLTEKQIVEITMDIFTQRKHKRQKELRKHSIDVINAVGRMGKVEIESD